MPSDRGQLRDRCLAAVVDRLERRGYLVERDPNRASNRLTVTHPCRFEIYVACVNGWGYPFWTERRLQPAADKFVVVLRYPGKDGPPECYLVPTLDWRNPELPLVHMKYQARDLSSEPEYGIRLTRRNHDAMKRYRWEDRMDRLPC